MSPEFQDTKAAGFGRPDVGVVANDGPIEGWGVWGGVSEDSGDTECVDGLMGIGTRGGEGEAVQIQNWERKGAFISNFGVLYQSVPAPYHLTPSTPQ